MLFVNKVIISTLTGLENVTSFTKIFVIKTNIYIYVCFSYFVKTKSGFLFYQINLKDNTHDGAKQDTGIEKQVIHRLSAFSEGARI